MTVTDLGKFRLVLVMPTIRLFLTVYDLPPNYLGIVWWSNVSCHSSEVSRFVCLTVVVDSRKNEYFLP